MKSIVTILSKYRRLMGSGQARTGCRVYSQVDDGPTIQSPKKIFFFHNPKAGGTSLCKWIGTQVGKAPCPNIENGIIEHVKNYGDYTKYRGHDFYSGHYGFDIYSQVTAGHQPITSFRHPLGRIVSLYNYFRFGVNAPADVLDTEAFFAVNAAKKLSFGDFVSSNDPRIDVYLTNHHFRQLTGSGWTLETSATIDDALGLIRTMPWYYLCEHNGLSLLWAQQAFGWNPKALRKLNRSRPFSAAFVQSRVERKTVEIINQKNTKDIAIYNYAVERLLAKFG